MPQLHTTQWLMAGLPFFLIIPTFAISPELVEEKLTAELSFDIGPVAQNVLDQHAKTSAEFSNLAASRQTPANPAATGQPLTHYHSFFSELLSWNNPRMCQLAAPHLRKCLR